MQNHHDESELLKQARKYDQEALAWIYQQYHEAIYRYIYHHLGETHTAQDLTGDVFRRLLQALQNGGGPTRQLSAWLYRVAHNLVVDELRRRQHRDHECLDDTPGELLRSDTEHLDELASKAIASERVRNALATLTEEQHQVVVLKFLVGMSNAEVAEITGKTVGAVKALQHRALYTLRAELAAGETPAPTRTAGTTAWAPSFSG